MTSPPVKFQAAFDPASPWSLSQARIWAETLLSSPKLAARRELLRALFSPHPETRKRAADTARRLTDRPEGLALLLPAAAQFASILAATPLEENRTRWHLGLVVARTARSGPDIATAAALLWQLAASSANVVRCSAVQGLGLLVLRDPSLLPEVEPYLLESLRTGTPAMRCRARDALKRLRLL